MVQTSRRPRNRGSIESFYGGISDDARIQKADIFQIASHLDIFSNPRKIKPYSDMVANQNTANAAKAFLITMFRYVPGVAKLYGLGIKTGGGSKPKLYEKSGSIITGDWTATTSGERSGSGAVYTKCLVDFHNYLYGGISGVSKVWAFGDVTSSPTFIDTATTLGTVTAQGITTVDDLLLLPANNTVLKKNGAGSGPTDQWTVGITLPSEYTVTDLCEIGDKVAIAVRNVDFNKSSKVAIWDKVSADPDQWIDFGPGQLWILDCLEGNLVGISSVGGVTGDASLSVKWWGGGSQAQQKFELISDDTTLTIYGNHTKVKSKHQLVFPIQIKLGGVTYTQNFAIGRKNVGYPWAYTFAHRLNNDTDLSGSVNGQYKYGGTYFVAFNDDGSINRTNNGVYASTTPFLISQKFTAELQGGADARRLTKQFMMAGLLTDVLTTGQSASLYYRVNSTSAWVLIHTYLYGDDSIGLGFEAGQDVNGDFASMKEWEFKLVPGSGAIITGVIYALNFFDDDGNIIEQF